MRILKQKSYEGLKRYLFFDEMMEFVDSEIMKNSMKKFYIKTYEISLS